MIISSKHVCLTYSRLINVCLHHTTSQAQVKTGLYGSKLILNRCIQISWNRLNYYGKVENEARQLAEANK